ncbi:hypothetical protein OIU34_23705 [Pararhizobium sp. BT-229]|uniref:hypothetical protein n=1 Tax=Pararhizobium sp. BT-229 TaxID=2986923 RepID=UPI0021F715AC|nr:hypothetical protein [Pararhizobium sp. BT-229]MCV9964903.1 hypothetical protein [Pararhizobium sp. BT-229]
MKLKALLLLVALTASDAAAADNGTRQAVEVGVSKGLGRFLSTYRETGMAGVQEAVTACYEDQKFGPTLDGIAACASMDKRAKDEDAVFSSQYGTPKVKFFVGSGPANRMKAALKRLKPSEQDRKVLLDAINEV